MTIIEKVEKVTGIKINFIKQMAENALNEIGKKDLEIINSHNFKIYKSVYANSGITIKCKMCGAEADFVDNIMYGFLSNDDTAIKYTLCSELIMIKACL